MMLTEPPRSGLPLVLGLVLLAVALLLQPDLLIAGFSLPARGALCINVMRGVVGVVALWLIIGSRRLSGAGFRRRVGKIVLLLTSTILSLLMVEIYFRIFDPQPWFLRDYSALFEYHETLGWQFVPDRATRIILPRENDSVITINAAGMRDQDYATEKPVGVRRISVLGDSFVAGVGVGDTETFTEVMERQHLDHCEVLNFGVDGYGPTQELLLLMDRVAPYDPDVVVMLVYIRNDFDDVSGTFDWYYPRPRAVLDGDGDIEFRNIPVPRKPHPAHQARIFNIRRLHLINRLRALLADKRDVRRMPPEVRWMARRVADDDRAPTFALLEAILSRADRFCQDRGIDFVVAIAPTIVQVHERDYWPRIVSRYALEESEYDLLHPNQAILGMTRRLGIPVLDLTLVLRTAAGRGERLYYRRNQHWNRRGHAVVAAELSSFLDRTGLAVIRPATGENESGRTE